MRKKGKGSPRKGVGRPNRAPRSRNTPGRPFRNTSGKDRAVSSAPSVVGAILPRSTFNFNGRAQKLADYDSDSSIRLSGTDLFSYPIQAGSSDAKAGFGGTASYWIVLSPTTISSRVQAIEKMFQWWIIRSLRVHYVPTIGTGTAVSLAMGFTTDAELSASFTTPTQQQVLELNPAVLTPVWALSTMEIKATGTKLFESYASGSEASDVHYQGLLVATLLGGTASVTYGQLWLEYVIDFYQPCPLLGSVDLLHRSRMLATPPESREEKKTRRLPQPEDEDFVEASPPVYRGLPSSAPGGSRYVATTEPDLLPPPTSTPKVPSRK
jgi:hypothetical protein